MKLNIMATEQNQNHETGFEYDNKATKDIAGSIYLLEEIKSSLETSFFVRYLRIGLIYTFEYGLLLLSLVILVYGLYYVTYFVGQLDSLSNNFPSASKDFFELQAIISHAETLAYLGVFVVSILLFIISRFFRRSRQRVVHLKKASDHLSQVIVNLKEAVK